MPLELLELDEELEELELVEELELELEEELEDEELLVLEVLLLDELDEEELELVDELLELDELDEEELEVWPPQADNSNARQVMAKGLFMEVTGYCADCLMGAQFWRARWRGS